MTTASRESVRELLRGYDPATSVIFGAPCSTLVTAGVFARIAVPAFGAHDRDGPLHREIARAFAAARAEGLVAPIVVGSIPFDTSGPSHLYVPLGYRFVDQADDHALGSRVPEEASAACHEGREAFEAAVRALLEEFRTGSVRKVVLSRARDVALTRDHDPGTFVASMLRRATNGHRFAVPLGDGETLVGASPELLLRKRGERIASNPLAGTARRGVEPDAAARRLLASAKDRDEHGLVVDQVRQILATYCRDLAVPESPSIIGSSALWHLSTWIEGTLDRDLDALALASALHPTPAVCGHPSAAARELIRRVEAYDRGPFTGMTGWMDERGDGDWVVTIRCAVLRARAARIFAGAGIVSGSVPELEWDETTAKMAPMLQALAHSQDLEGALA